MENGDGMMIPCGISTLSVYFYAVCKCGLAADVTKTRLSM